MLNQRQRQQARGARGRDRRLNATDPAAPARAMVMNDAPEPGRARTSSSAATRAGRARRSRGGSSASLAGPEAAAVHEGQRPARAGPGHRQPGQPADGPGAWSTASGTGTSARGWSPRPATSACGATRPRIPSCSTAWPRGSSPSGWSIKAMHRRIMLSSTYQQSQRQPRPRRPSRPGEPAALAVQPPPARLRGDARRDPAPSAGTLDPAMGGRPVD